jgi:hypothetical protein
VVDLRHQGPAIVLDALDHPHLPQRLGPVEPLGHDPADEPAQLVLAARRRQRGVADVVLEVEVGIVDPHRPPQRQRHGGDLLPVAGHQRQPPADRSAEVVVGRWRPLEDPHRPDVHVVDVVLDVEERRIQRAQPIHE